MSRGPDAGTIFARAVKADSCRASCPVRIIDSEWTRWSSATFDGGRHKLSLDATDSPALDKWIGTLSEARLPMLGLLVADVAVRSVRRAEGVATIEIEALTVEE